MPGNSFNPTRWRQTRQTYNSFDKRSILRFLCEVRECLDTSQPPEAIDNIHHPSEINRGEYNRYSRHRKQSSKKKRTKCIIELGQRRAGWKRTHLLFLSRGVNDVVWMDSNSTSTRSQGQHQAWWTRVEERRGCCSRKLPERMRRE